MDIAALLPVVHKFASELNMTKHHAPAGISWYNFPTLGVFTILERLLTGPHRDLRYLISSQPVLDLGCGDGDLTLLLSHLGFDVDAVDNPGTNANRMEAVRYLTQLVNSPARVHECDLDRLQALPRPHYGLAVFLGVLYHLKNPLFALEQLASSCDYALISTRVFEGAQPVAYLVEPGELNADATNYWLLTPNAFERLLRRAGFEVVSTHREGAIGDADAALADGRMYVLARSLRPPASPIRLLSGWYAEEPSAFRWTGPSFSFTGPAGATRLTLRCRSLVERLTISGTAHGRPLAPAIFTGAGEHEHTFPLEPGAGIPTVELALDHTYRPPAPDCRELGIAIATDGGLRFS
jgi:tRNA (mo5U34)-methyltransferase